MNRRQLTTLLGGAATAWPLAARAQQRAMPVVGFLHPQSPDTVADPLRGFRQGLKEEGFIEGDNVTIEYRWADSQVDRLPALVAELVRRRVTVIASIANDAAFAAKAATTTIPIVFITGEDPAGLGLVASLARPGGNLTGVNFLSSELVSKRLELLRELVPAATRVAALLNPAIATITAATLRDVETAGPAMGLQIDTHNASTAREIDLVFANLLLARPDALFVAPGPFFTARRVQLAQWAARLAVPAIYSGRQYPEVGGLMSYGANLAYAYRQVGVYTGRILKGVKPSDLPVPQLDRFELVINGQTARMLSFEIPPTLLARADEVIE